MLNSWPSLIVSTSQAVLTYRDGRWNVFHQGAGVYYGITWSETEIYLLARRVFRKYGLDECVVRVNAGDAFLRRHFTGGHQILWADGALYIVDTGRDQIVRWRQGGTSDVVFSTGEGKDTVHLNSVSFDGERFYVGGCPHTTLKSGKALITPSTVHVFDRQWKPEQPFAFGRGIHNIYVEGGLVYACDSGGGRLCATDRETGQLVREGAVGGWTRGLARGDGCFVLGSSALTETERRYTGDSALYLLDNDLNVLDLVRLRNVGQVYEVRLLTQIDQAHNEIPCPLNSPGQGGRTHALRTRS